MIAIAQFLKNFGRSVILTSVVVTGLVGGVRWLGGLEGMELGMYDQLLRSRPDEGPDERLLLVAITEQDLQTRKEYPITDGTLAQLLNKIQEYKPRAIGIDIIRDIPIGDKKGRVALQKVLKESDNLIAVCKLSSENEPGIAAAPGVPEERVGAADLPQDPGGTIRRSSLLANPTPPKVPPPSKHLCNITDKENQVPSLSFQLAMIYLEAGGIKPEEADKGNKGAGAIKIGPTVFRRLSEDAGGYRNADAGNYQLMINYRSAKNSLDQVSLSDVLKGKVAPDLIKDRVVLVGYTAPIVKDDFYTPYSGGLKDDQTMPGVVIHAQNVSQILSAVENKRPLIWYWTKPVEWLWIFGWSLVGGTLAWGVKRLWIFGVGVVVALGGLSGICYFLFLQGGWIPLIPPALALVPTAIVVVFVVNAKGIYQTVKKLILNIEIDEAKKQQQVAAITESETFTELEKKAQELRNRKRDKSARDVNRTNSETEETPPTPEVAEPPEAEDYFQQLQQQGKKLRKTEEPSNSSETEEVLPTSEETASPEEDDYFQQLQKKGKRYRKNDDQSN